MSKYTTEVRYICETAAGYDESKGFQMIDDILTKAAPAVFDFEFPIFDEAYRLTLEKTILRHYYTREIGEETVGLWKLRLWDRLNVVMPYYNKLYLSQTLQFNPLYDVDYTKTSTTQLDGETSNTGTDTLAGTTSGSESTTGSRTSSGSEVVDSDTSNTETKNLTDTTSMTRTDNLTRTDDLTRTDNLASTSSNTRTDNLTRTDNTLRTDSFTETKNLSDGHTGTSGNTHYDLYSDTPQGGLTGVDAETYLTNARKITDSGSDSYTDTHTGTDANAGTSANTGTVTNTGTVQDSGSGSNTGTVKSTGTVKNTGTVQDAGSVTHTGTDANIGTVDTTTTTNSSDSETGSRTTSGTESSTRNTTAAGTVSNLTEYTEHVVGKQGSMTFVQMIREYREAMINVDQMVLDELKDLFINLW